MDELLPTSPVTWGGTVFDFPSVHQGLEAVDRLMDELLPAPSLVRIVPLSFVTSCIISL